MKILLPICVLVLTVSCASQTSTLHAEEPLAANVLLDGGRVVLPNGWTVSPAGKATKLPGDMPERILFSPDKKQILVNTGGYNVHGISVLDASTGAVLQHVRVPRTFVGM